MSAPVKMGVVVRTPNDFVERNPATVAYTRDRMARDIIESGRLPDQASWKREEVPQGLYDLGPTMTTFTLDAVSQAHVIVFVEPDGRHTWTSVHEVQLGTTQQAQERANALNVEHGHVDKFDPEDGEWWGKHYEVATVPLAYPEPEIKVTQEFSEESAREALIRESRWDRR